MPPDSVLSLEVKGWLKKAALDIRSAGYALTAIPPILSDVVYHSQQAAEKALKAFLVWNNILFRKTYSIEEIGEQCLEVDSTLRPLIDQGAPLLNMPGNFGIREISRNLVRKSRKMPSEWRKQFIRKFLNACRWMYTPNRSKAG